MARKNTLAANINRSVTEGKPEVIAMERDPQSKVSAFQVSTEIAKSNICFRNFAYSGSRVAFPLRPDMRTVDRYFPLAEGGPLLVDEPGNEFEAQDCEEKAKVIRGGGCRYLIIRKDTDMYEAMKQLSSQAKTA